MSSCLNSINNILELVRIEEAETEMRRTEELPFPSPAITVAWEGLSSLVMDGDVVLGDPWRTGQATNKENGTVGQINRNQGQGHGVGGSRSEHWRGESENGGTFVQLGHLLFSLNG